MSSIVRKVNKVEQSVLHWSVNTMCLLDGGSIKLGDLKEALNRTIQKYSYLKLRLESTSDNELAYVENSPEEIEAYTIEWNETNDENEFNDWQKRLNVFGSKNFLKRLFNIEVDALTSQNKYRLYLSISHAGCDGRSVFYVLRDLIGNLDDVISKIDSGKIELKKFLEVHQEIKNLFDVEALKSEAVYQDEKHAKFSQMTVKETNADKLNVYKSSFIAHFWQMTPEETKSFVEKCKKHETSVQGVISVAKMIVLINETSGLSSEPVDVLNSIPCDMRYYFGLDGDDLMKGGASLFWVQSLKSSDKLWELASWATKEINRQRAKNEGFKNWQKILLSINQSKASFLATSMGKFSLNEDRLKSFKIADLRFSATTPIHAFNPDPQQIANVGYYHAFTFQDRFTLSFSHSFPSLSFDYGEKCLNEFVYIIRQLIDVEQPIVGEIVDKLKKSS